MNYVKILSSFSLGILVGYVIFTKEKIATDLTVQNSSCDLQITELTTLKKKLSSCERNEQFANNEINKLREKLSQRPGVLNKESKNESKYTPELSKDDTNQFSINTEEEQKRSSKDKNILSADQTNQPLKSEKWIHAEKELDTLEKDDTNSRSDFLKKVAIRDFNKTLSSMDKVDNNNQNFISLQGSYQGHMNDLISDGIDYHLELELSFPTQGEGTYSARLEGRGLNLSTQGRGEAKGFSTVKDTGSRAVFLKLNRDVYLQLYWNSRSNTVIGNAYRNLGKGFKKFGEFELVRS